MEQPLYILEELLQKEQWTAAEREWLLQYLDEHPDHELVKAALFRLYGQEDQFRHLLPVERAGILLSNIHGKAGLVSSPVKVRRMSTMLRVVAAAVLLVVVSGLVYFMSTRDRAGQSTPLIANLPQNDLPPGTPGAILVLDDGRHIRLDSLQDGTVSTIGDLTIIKKDGRIIYQGQAGSSAVVYNTMTTAMGNQYQLVLADGTRVWLNAGSSIRYPVSFTGKERVVDISGEVYFEVAENASMPFKAKVGGMEVAVLGTRFCVNAYNDEEAIKTTLLEGSVRVLKGNNGVLLRPGQQAALQTNDQFKLKEVAAEEAIAWKNGKFLFRQTDIRSVMKQIARWYNVAIVYEGKAPDKTFSGDISNNVNLSVLLEVFKETGVKFTVQGNKIIVKE